MERELQRIRMELKQLQRLYAVLRKGLVRSFKQQRDNNTGNTQQITEAVGETEQRVTDNVDQRALQLRNAIVSEGELTRMFVNGLVSGVLLERHSEVIDGLVNVESGINSSLLTLRSQLNTRLNEIEAKIDALAPQEEPTTGE